MQDFCNGGALGAAMEAGVYRASHPRHWQRALSTLQQAAAGMAYVHSCRVTHGDLNPSNILLKVRSALCAPPLVASPCGYFTPRSLRNLRSEVPDASRSIRGI